MPRDNFENLDEEIMRVIFDLFDSDGGGTIGREEVPEMIRTLLFEVPSEEQVDQLIAKFDDSGDGELDFEEFSNMMKMYVSPLDLTLPPEPVNELGLTLRMRKDGSICIMAIDPALCPVLHRAAVDGILRPGHPIAKIDKERYTDVLEAAAYIRARIKERSVLITLAAPEIGSNLGHHLTIGWWQNSALASAGFSESREIRESRNRVRQSASNTLLSSYYHGARYCAYI